MERRRCRERDGRERRKRDVEERKTKRQGREGVITYYKLKLSKIEKRAKERERERQTDRLTD
jgi:hypothetical protein